MKPGKSALGPNRATLGNPLPGGRRAHAHVSADDAVWAGRDRADLTTNRCSAAGWAAAGVSPEAASGLGECRLDARSS